MNDIWSGVVTIAVAIIGVATIAVILSKNANTSQVITSGGDAFAKALSAAVSPISGASTSLSMPSFMN